MQVQTPRGEGAVVEAPDPVTGRVPVRLSETDQVRYFHPHELNAPF